MRPDSTQSTTVHLSTNCRCCCGTNNAKTMKYFTSLAVVATTLIVAGTLVSSAVNTNNGGAPAPVGPLKVSVYYESHCPDSKYFIMDQLYPQFCKVQQYLDLNLVPFGKAHSTDDGFTCQHGPKECRGNTIHNCVLKRVQDPKAQVNYVNCAMYDPDYPGHIEKTCVEENGLNVEEINVCLNSQEGYQLMLKAEKETKAMTPGPRFVPTIVFDDEYNDKDQNLAFRNFESALCLKLVSRGHTDVCLNGVIKNPQTC